MATLKVRMMIRIIFAILIVWLIAPQHEAFAQEAPDNLAKLDPRMEFFPLRVTARIVDESGQPIEDADIDLGIANAVYKGEIKHFFGRSSMEGTFTAESPAHAAYVRFVVTKKGYYTSRMNHEKFERMPEKLRIAGRFEPWNPTVDIVLKKIGNPIPMIVRIPDMKVVPATDANVPFDLMAWDWLPPHGKGKVGDLTFRFEVGEKSNGYRPVSMTMRFASEHDGLIPITELRGVESLLRFPREAPEADYEMKSYSASKDVVNGGFATTPEHPPLGYFLRLRTQVDAEGRVVSAYYGKIIRTDLRNADAFAIQVFRPGGAHEKASFQFAAYYINPTPNDRNLEYDQTHNLAPEVESGFQWPP